MSGQPAPEAPRWVSARIGDLLCIGVAVVIGALAFDAAEAARGQSTVNELLDVLGLGAIGALWWRRRAPALVAALAFGASAVSPLAAGAAIVAVYSVAAYHRGRWTSPSLCVVYVLYLAAGAMHVSIARDGVSDMLARVVPALVFTLAAWGWGTAVRSRRQLLEALADRARRAEADQQARLAEARQAERARIAAEMHDVLAHRLSLLSVHAGAIELRPNAAPEDLAHAAGVVRSTAHHALEDLRGVIGLLRDDEATVVPQPTLDELPELVAECREAGMELDVTNELPPEASVPADVGRHAFHVIREALTNARKHAPGEPVHLVLAGGRGEGVSIEVRNRCGVDMPDGAAVPGAGLGLVGLRERVELLGGRLERDVDTDIDISDRHQHIWHLHVWLPWST